MKTATEKNHRALRPGAAAVRSPAPAMVLAVVLAMVLAMPLAASHAVAAEDQGRDPAQTPARDMTRDPRLSSLRFSAAKPTQRSTTIVWADLDLSRPAGLDRLYQRLSGAIVTVCAPREHIRNIAGNRNRKACLKAAMDDAVRDVGHPGLEALHASRTGRSVEPEQQTASR